MSVALHAVALALTGHGHVPGSGKAVLGMRDDGRGANSREVVCRGRGNEHNRSVTCRALYAQATAQGWVARSV